MYLLQATPGFHSALSSKRWKNSGITLILCMVLSGILAYAQTTIPVTPGRKGSTRVARCV